MTQHCVEPLAELNRPPHRTDTAILLAILLAGLILRVVWFEVPTSPGPDEQTYIAYTQRIDAEGWGSYDKLVSEYLGNSANWIYPNPLRWGWTLLTWLSCKFTSDCSFDNLSAVSTIAGIVSILLIFALGRELVSSRVGLMAAALMVTSPLQLAMGRRALQDEPFCALVLAFLWLFVRLLRSDRPPRWLVPLTIVVGTLAMGVKELFLLFYPAFVLLIILNRRSGKRIRLGEVLALAIPPLGHFVVFALLSGDPGAYFEIGRNVPGTAAAAYNEQYQNGPLHRLAFDLFVLAPVVCLLATGALAFLVTRPKESEQEVHWVAIVFIAVLVAFSLVPFKSVRYVIVADPLMRLLAAWALIHHPLGARRRQFAYLMMVVLVNAAVELTIFHRVFIEAQVYDPVTYFVLQALKAVPH